MSYDLVLADRVRDVLADEPGVTEKKMFGGLAFLVGGHMAVAASGQGGLLLRADPARAEELLDGDAVTRFEMGGRSMAGWLHVTHRPPSTPTTGCATGQGRRRGRALAAAEVSPGLRQTETWLSLSAVNGERSQPAYRASSSRPASLAIRSHSSGQT